MVDFQNLTERELLTLCIYGEARGEPPVGKLAVAHVVLNRAKNPSWWGKDIKSVILKPKQFSCFNPSDPNAEKLDFMARSGYYDRASLTLAHLVLGGHTIDPTGGATHYHSVAVEPEWAKSMKLTKRINRHLFYKEVG